ncbi:DnaJ (Hsp40), sub C, member 11 [Homalodisca vitripennis]|nr:DnaJ (Hsp40), sub C, member 11 [Homalodisca vitripennis]
MEDDNDDSTVTIEEDYYTFLNVPRNASNEEIINAYRRLSILYHPDKHVDPVRKKDAELLFHKVKKAYEGGESIHTTIKNREKKEGKENGSNIPKSCLESSPGFVTAQNARLNFSVACKSVKALDFVTGMELAVSQVSEEQGLGPKHMAGSTLTLPVPHPDLHLPVPLQMTQQGADERADIDILISIRLSPVLV